jgi:hypothetical protein
VFGFSATATNGNEAEDQNEALEKPFGVVTLHIFSDGDKRLPETWIRRLAKKYVDRYSSAFSSPLISVTGQWISSFPITRLHVGLEQHLGIECTRNASLPEKQSSIIARMDDSSLPFGIDRSLLRLDSQDPYFCLHFIMIFVRDQERSLAILH